MKDPILLKRIWKEVEAGRVVSVSDGDLTLFKYHPSMMAENRKKWNNINRLCRGIIFDTEAHIVARPFPKFFNMHERAETSPEILPWDGGYHVFEKVDGSCGIGYYRHEGWKLATPGSLGSEQALRGTEILNSQYGDSLRALPVNVTPVFEIVYPENRVVVDYSGKTFLSLLAIFNLSGEEWHPSRVDEIAERCSFHRPKHYVDITFDQLLEENPPFEDDLLEGFVVWFADGQRVKIKDPRYLRIHKLLGSMTPKGVIDLIRGKEYCYHLQELPQDIQKSFDDIRAFVQDKFWKIKHKAEDIARDIPRGETVTRKDQALWIQANTPNDMTGLIFSLLDGRDIESDIWKLILKRMKE